MNLRCLYYLLFKKDLTKLVISIIILVSHEGGIYMSKTFGERISELLRKKGMTQKELAIIIGVTEATMSRYVKDSRVPRGEIVANIATALQTTSDYLLDKEEKADIKNDYPQIQRLIARNAAIMTDEQKRELINALFDTQSK